MDFSFTVLMAFYLIINCQLEGVIYGFRIDHHFNPKVDVGHHLRDHHPQGHHLLDHLLEYFFLAPSPQNHQQQWGPVISCSENPLPLCHHRLVLLIPNQ